MRDYLKNFGGIWLVSISLISALVSLSLSLHETFHFKPSPPLSVEDFIGLKNRVENLENGSYVSFDPADAQGYLRIRTNVADLLVSIVKIEPYLDGQKVYLAIGNPNFMTFSGLDFNVN